MTNGASAKLLRLYVPLCVLWGFGVCLLMSSAFSFLLAFIEPHGRHGAGGLRAGSTFGALLLIDGIGFLMPQLSAKFFSALLLAGGAVYLFSGDAFRRENWWFYCLLLLPLLLTFLLLTLSLREKYTGLPVREMSNAN